MHNDFFICFGEGFAVRSLFHVKKKKKTGAILSKLLLYRSIKKMNDYLQVNGQNAGRMKFPVKKDISGDPDIETG